MIVKTLGMLAVLSFLGGCGSGAVPVSKNPAVGVENRVACPVEFSREHEISPEPVTFTLYDFNTNNLPRVPWEGPVHRKITEKTGVRLEISYCPAGQEETMVGVMIAGNDFPDLISTGSSTSHFIDAAVLRPLDDLLEKEGTNIRMLFGDSLNKLRHTKDGRIYFIASPGNQRTAMMESNQCFMVQYDVLEKTGYHIPKTLDDLYNILKQYTAVYRELNGKPLIPWGLWADSWGYNITVNNPALWASGNVDSGDVVIDDATFKSKYFNATDSFKTYLKWLNRLYREGMLDLNHFILKNDAWKSLVSTGRVLAFVDGTWDIAEPEAVLRKSGMPERCYARLPITYDRSISDKSNVYCESYQSGLAITNSCKAPERAMRFMDYFSTDEGTLLMNWGIEGVHYAIVDGKRIENPEIVERKKMDNQYAPKEGIGVLWIITRGNTTFMSDGQFAGPNNPETMYANADEWTRKVMDVLGIRYWGQMFDTDPNKQTKFGYAWTLPLPSDSAGAAAERDADTYRHIKVPAIVAAKDDTGFEKKWNDFVEGLYSKCRVDLLEKDYDEALQSRLKLWRVIR